MNAGTVSTHSEWDRLTRDELVFENIYFWGECDKEMSLLDGHLRPVTPRVEARRTASQSETILPTLLAKSR